MDATLSTRQIIAFADDTLVALGDVATVAAASRAALDEAPAATLLLFDAQTSEPVELDLRGTVADVVARLAPPAAEPPAPRAPGRPKLGVVAREVTLLPRHWEWLAEQSGGASVTLRKLVETARREGTGADRLRRAQDSAYRFANTMAGNSPGFEEAMRALYANDAARFHVLTDAWPVGVRDHARELAARAFSASEG
jgi:hypothetical protein